MVGSSLVSLSPLYFPFSMNRIQFWILTSFSILVVLLLVGQVVLGRLTDNARLRVAAAQQVIGQGEASQSMLKQLAARIYQDAEKTQDPGLKDLVSREQISFNPSNANSGGTSSPESSSSSSSSPSSSYSTPIPPSH
jgi:hypothetical protein